jgi:ligand-binding SRPBCC domain-containing protein
VPSEFFALVLGRHRVSRWLREDGRLFIHVFCHASHAYPFEAEGDDNWMGLFRVVPGGVAIEDVVEYRMPFGPLGRLAHALVVRRHLDRIFAYRARVIRERFPLQPAREGQARFA